MSDLILVTPNETHKDACMEYRQEHIDNGEQWINGSCGLIRYENYGEWLKRVMERKNIEVPADTYFSLRKSDGRIIGTIQLRNYLNESLRKVGGHIGYGIRPSERGKGYGTQQLNLVLDEARKLLIDKVMITCDKDNTASAKVAVNNGGLLTWEGYVEEEKSVIQHYWISLF